MTTTTPTEVDGEIADSFKTYMAGGFNMVERKLFARLACDPSMPKWQQAAMHCWGHMDRRGHCPLPAGKLTEILGKKSDVDTRKEVRKAISKGWLAEGSNDRCLVAPYGVVYKAGNWKLRGECEFH